MAEKSADKVKAGLARAEILPPERRAEIARDAAIARWGTKLPRATHKGNFKDDFGIDVECYVLDDDKKTAVISQTGMARALGLPSTGGAFPRFFGGKAVANSIGAEVRQKLDNPIKFQTVTGGAERNPSPRMVLHGFDVTLIIDLCNAIVAIEAEGKLYNRHRRVAAQAHIILGASAKAGIQNLVYRLSGYNPTTEEVIAAFKLYVQEEAKKYEPEFPNELYEQWHRLYELAVPKRGKPWHFKSLTVRHVYYPLAKSNGRILELLKALKSKDGDRTKKLFQFLNVIGARALRIQLGRVLEMAESSPDKFTYENKIAERFGGQKELELIVPTPSVIPADDSDLLQAAKKMAWKPEDDKEAAN